MKQATSKRELAQDNDMRKEYDFHKGVRGRHHKILQHGAKTIIHKSNGKTVIKDILPPKGIVVIEPDIHIYFPDSKSVNQALRCLIPLLPKKRAKSKEAGK